MGIGVWVEWGWRWWSGWWFRYGGMGYGGMMWEEDKGDRANANILGEWGMWKVRNGMGMGEGDKVGGQGGCPPYKLKKFRL